jgi:hypothetical protein
VRLKPLRAVWLPRGILCFRRTLVRLKHDRLRATDRHRVFQENACAVEASPAISSSQLGSSSRRISVGSHTFSSYHQQNYYPTISLKAHATIVHGTIGGDSNECDY